MWVRRRGTSGTTAQTMNERRRAGRQAFTVKEGLPELARVRELDDKHLVFPPYIVIEQAEAALGELQQMKKGRTLPQREAVDIFAGTLTCGLHFNFLMPKAPEMKRVGMSYEAALENLAQIAKGKTGDKERAIALCEAVRNYMARLDADITKQLRVPLHLRTSSGWTVRDPYANYAR